MAFDTPIVLGRYELHASIAAGGMASVHVGRVRGAAGFARTVAIKRLHPHFARDAAFVTMFNDEARIVARIRHPNVVPILDVVAEEDELFLVMEYVHGESLARLVRAMRPGAMKTSPEGKSTALDGRVPPPIAAKIFADVLHGLHAAHEATTAEGEPLGIVHRDVTPHNVLIGVDGNARIADFGIAKATHRASQTADGQLKGKLCYVAPEQLQGHAIDRTTDVYAAAVTLWEALTGRVLFDAEHEARILEKVLVGATRPPSELAPGVPPELDEIVMRGLESKPRKRFPTAREMALALERAVAQSPASEVGAWVEGRAGEALSRRTALIARIERMGSAPSLPPENANASTPAVSPPSAPPPAQSAPPPAQSVSSVALGTRGTAANLSAVAGLPPRRSARVAGGIAVALIALIALGWARARATPPAAASMTPMPVAPDTVPVIPEPESLAPVSPLHEATTPPPRAAAPLPATRPPKRSSAAVVDCTLPYTRDEAGNKIYKRECL